ncbi:MAG: signal peptidase II [bacterium]
MRISLADLLFSATALAVFIGDRVTKMMASEYLSHVSTPVFPGLKLTLMFNTGISFSLFSSPQGVIAWELTAVIAVVVALLIVAWRYYAVTRTADIAFGLIIGGAVGNFVDRVCIGGVIDFIELYCGRWSWPTFNGADVAIVIGFILLVSEALYETKAE